MADNVTEVVLGTTDADRIGRLIEDVVGYQDDGSGMISVPWRDLLLLLERFSQMQDAASNVIVMLDPLVARDD